MLASFLPPAILPVALLLISNVFMTFAWYGHLKFKAAPLWTVIGISWAIAFAEYCFAVPANRYGHGIYSAAEFKTIREIAPLLVFCVFPTTYLGEAIHWNDLVGFALICAAAVFIFHKW